MRRFRPVLSVCVLFALLACGTGASAQHAASAVMLSDIHFDPFRDPGKLPRLREQPVAGWPAILGVPDSPTQAADTAALQESCHSRALDTDWALLRSALTAAHDETPRPLFVVVPGDLLAHEFTCRYTHLVPGATPDEIAAFAAKTVIFVLAQLRATFPRVPVYAALGNNDSGCADYRETPGDLFMKTSAAALAEAAGIPPGSLSPLGDYSVPLPSPVQNSRLLVLQDDFQSRQFTTCAAAADRTPEQGQIDWLRAQLQAARTAHGHVWVVAHLPTGVDVYNSFRRFVFKPAALCSAEPASFLANTALADALLDYPDVVSLVVFGHTHVDEMRVLERDAGAGTTGPAGPIPAPIPGPIPGPIPVKIVPSVSPYIGNHPAFLTATVDTRTAVLTDWRTFVSPGATGSTPPWAEGYRFSTAYHLPDFSGASALKLADSFTADKTGQGAASTTFRQHFYPGDLGIYAVGLAQIWPAYACSIRENRPSAVHRCICNITPLAQP